MARLVMASRRYCKHQDDGIGTSPTNYGTGIGKAQTNQKTKAMKKSMMMFALTMMTATAFAQQSDNKRSDKTAEPKLEMTEGKKSADETIVTTATLSNTAQDVSTQAATEPKLKKGKLDVRATSTEQ
jgi:hypothetical protein